MWRCLGRSGCLTRRGKQHVFWFSLGWLRDVHHYCHSWRRDPKVFQIRSVTSLCWCTSDNCNSSTVSWLHGTLISWWRIWSLCCSYISGSCALPSMLCCEVQQAQSGSQQAVSFLVKFFQSSFSQNDVMGTNLVLQLFSIQSYLIALTVASVGNLRKRLIPCARNQ